MGHGRGGLSGPRINTQKASIQEGMATFSQQVVEKLAAGWSPSQISSFLEKKFQVTPEEAQGCFSAAFALIQADVAVETEQQYNLALLRRAELYKKTYEVGDYKAALAVEQDRSKLLGLYNVSNEELKPLLDLISAVNNAVQPSTEEVLPIDDGTQV